MKGRVLLTGGGGFLGRHLARILRQQGHELVAPTRSDCDLLDRPSLDRTLAGVKPDIVIHAAAHSGGLGICLGEPADVFYKNVVMSANILDAGARAGVKRFLAIGSTCAYPAELDDLREDRLWAGPVHASVEGLGLSKRLQEVGLRAYFQQFGMRGQMAIITSMYGEHDVFSERRAHVTAALIKKFTDAVQRKPAEVVCWGTGEPVREFMYVGDAAEAVVRLLDTEYFEPLNIGTGIGTSIKDLAHLIAEHIGFKGKITWDTTRPDGVMRKVTNISRMKEVLKWSPPTSLRAGVERTVRWYLVNKEAADARP